MLFFFGVGLLTTPVQGEADRTPLLAPQRVTEITRDSVRSRQYTDLARQALADGFPSLALFFSAQARTGEIADTAELALLDRLDLASRLVLGDYAEARARLPADGFDDPVGQLLKGLLNWGEGRFEASQRLINAIAPDSLSPEWRAWWWYGRGLLAEQAKDRVAAGEFYRRARTEALSPLVEGHLYLAEMRILLLGDSLESSHLQTLQEQIDALDGRSLAFRFILQKVALLDWLDQREEALLLLRDNFPRIPVESVDLREQFLLLEGLLASGTSERGREALRTLLETGQNRSYLRIALPLWSAGDSPRESMIDFLTTLIEREPKHVLRDELLARRARLFLASELSALNRQEEFPPSRARQDAEKLLATYPGSRVTVDALQILAIVAWERREFRTAASVLNQWRNAVEDPGRRAELSSLMGDSFYRAGDYRNAAEAYLRAWQEDSIRLDRAVVRYQYIFSLLAVDQPSRAAEALDAMTVDETASARQIDLHWQAEWNLARHWQRRNEHARALERVETLLAREEPVSSALRQRFRWLQAHLTYQVGDLEESIRLMEEFLPVIEASVVPDDARAEHDRLLGQSLLLLAQAHLGSGSREEGFQLLATIRERFPRSEAGVFAILVEARFFAAEGQTVNAATVLEDFLTRLQQNRNEEGDFPRWASDQRDFIALAYYEAALYHLRSGVDVASQEKAIARLESLIQDFPAHPLSYFARIRQGDILRQMNNFSSARHIYEQVLRSFPDHPERDQVRVALADTWLASANRSDDRAAENGTAMLERLLDSPGVVPDIRIEAAYKLGQAWIRFGNEERALALYFQLQKEFWENTEDLEIGSNGRFWLARALLERARRTPPGPPREAAQSVYQRFIREASTVASRN